MYKLIEINKFDFIKNSFLFFSINLCMQVILSLFINASTNNHSNFDLLDFIFDAFIFDPYSFSIIVAILLIL